MSEPRIKSGLWVRVALRMGEQDGRYGTILRKGDADAGGILVVLRGREGLSVLSQVRGADGELGWLRATGPVPVEQSRADDYITRQIRFDPDLWVIEFEAPDMLPPFAGKIT